MPVFEHSAYDHHEGLHFFQDTKTGLQALIAIHSTTLGPATGGCRFWTYANSDQAIHDVLRLSKGMSYKSAMANLPLGGGKSVIMKPDQYFDRKALFEAFGRCVESLGGQYITAEDVGVSVEDMNAVKHSTNYVAGLIEGASAGGDPSPITAKGVFLGLKASVKQALGQDSLKGVRIAIQGIGHVGGYLCQHLAEAGAQLIITDINEALLKKVAQSCNAKPVSPDQIYDQDIDVFSPCALGAVINPETLDRLTAKVIAGAANNQLSRPEMGQELLERNILYAPDYIINAGGIINIYSEISGTYNSEWVDRKLEDITKSLREVYITSDLKGLPTNQVANTIAQERINHKKNVSETSAA